jgi:hypothetical protein
MESKRIRALALGLSVACLGAVHVHAQPMLPLAPSGSTTWGNWSFEWHVGDANKEGLVITNVRWKGTKVLGKGSLPVIRVKYRGDGEDLTDGCGPYADRIHWGNTQPLKGQLLSTTQRIFDNKVLEIAISAHIGGYYVFQAWYFRKSGRLEPMLYSSNWSCCDDEHENDHKHHPYWRLDFDVESTSNEVWRIRTKDSGKVKTFKYPKEWNSWQKADDKEIAWTVNKPGSSKHVLIRYPANERRDTPGSPWFRFSSKDMGVRRYHGSESEKWPFEPKYHLGYKYPIAEPFSANGTDIVFWAVGHMTHIWEYIDVLKPAWHSSGPIIDVSW